MEKSKKTKRNYKSGRKLNRRPRARGGRKFQRVQKSSVTYLQEQLSDPKSKFGCNPFKGIGGISNEEEMMKITRREKAIIQEKANENFECFPPVVIENLTFNLFDYDELKSMAVVNVSNTESEGRNSVNDTRMGVVDSTRACSTCRQDNITCPGHYGMIQLAEPIVHPLYLREVMDILTCVCNSCGELLLTEKEIQGRRLNNLRGTKRLKALSAACKGLLCRKSVKHKEQGAIGCAPNPVYKPARIRDVEKISYDVGEKGIPEMYRSANEIFEIFNAISEEDARLLGFENGSHPNRMIMRAVVVIPPCARAPVFLEGLVQEDHITKMYKDIIRYNNQLKASLQKEDVNEENRRKEIRKQLIFAIKHLIDNTDKKYCQGQQHPYISIKQRVQGKEAIIRGLLMGKRVNFSGRTVLGPDPSLKFGQIRIPESMAPYLTRHVKVNTSNIGELNGLLKTPGDEPSHITHVTPKGKSDVHRIRITNKNKNTYQLKIGDEVDRWLQNGDYIAFNRQPSLHKFSMMGYEVVLSPLLTIGLHLSSTGPHNADFDGDEGNLHVSQTAEGSLDIKAIMNVKNCIMSGQSNRNIIGAVMDAVLAPFTMTQFNPLLTSSEYYDMLDSITNTDSHRSLPQRLKARHIPRMSARGLISALFPEDFYYHKGDVIIEDGVLVQGVLTKKHIGASSGSIIQVIMKDYGQKRASDFITDIYFLATRYLDRFPVSVGLDDCFLEGNKPRIEIEKTIQEAKMVVSAMGKKLEDPLEEERREKTILAKVNTARGLGARISEKYLPDDNAFQLMIKSGSKGSTFNLAQITSMLGQQYILGKRVPESISKGRRTLPYFDLDEIDPEARGFITSSFLTGLTPPELFFHQAGGRVGLMDTANKTSETGYIHHRMVKALEDVKVDKDGSVRSASGAIFQYTYGDDGFDSSKLETVSIKSGTFASFINIKRAAAKINSRYGAKKFPKPTGQIPAAVQFEENQVYEIDGREATVISVEKRVQENEEGNFIKQEMVQLAYNDSDEIVWKLPKDIGKQILEPSKYQNVYSINDRDAIILNRKVESFWFKADSSSVSQLVNVPANVIPGGKFIVNNQKGTVTQINYIYQIEFLDNREVAYVNPSEIGKPIRTIKVN